MKRKIIEMRKLIFFILNLSILSSCNTKLENELRGNWIINNIEYNNSDIKSGYLSANILTFLKDETCQFPSFTEAYGTGKWDLEPGPSTAILYIDSEDPIFNGMFNIIFKVQNTANGEIHEITLSNETTLIKCVKAF